MSAEWICAAVVSLSLSESNRIKLGAAGACAAICSVLSKQMSKSEIVTKLACEAMYELSFDESNRHLFAIVGACELIVATLQAHMTHMQTAQHICRAIAGLAKVSTHHSENPDLLGAAGVCEVVTRAIKTHIFSSPLVEAGCAAIAALCHNGHTRNQKAFFSLIFSDDWNMINTSTSDANLGGMGGSSNNLLSGGSQESPRKGLFTNVSNVLGLASPEKPAVPVPSVAPSSRRTATASTKPGVTPGTGKSDTSATDTSAAAVTSESKDKEELNIFKLLTEVLTTHRSNPSICSLACRAARALSMNNYLVQREFSEVALLPAVMKALKIHKSVDSLVEHACWLLTHIIAPAKDPMKRTSSMEQVSVVKDLIDLGINDTNVKTSATASAAVGENVHHLITIPNTAEMYKMTDNWEVLLSALQLNYQKPHLARQICAAVRYVCIQYIFDYVIFTCLWYINRTHSVCLRSVVNSRICLCVTKY